MLKQLSKRRRWMIWSKGPLTCTAAPATTGSLVPGPPQQNADCWFSRTEACSLPHLWFYCFITSLLSLPRCLEKLLTFQQLLTSWNSKKDAEHLSFWIRGSQKFCSWAFGNANSVSIFGSSAVSKSDCHPPFPVLRATWRSAGAQENSGRALLGGLGQRHVLAVSHLVTGETLGSFGRCAWYRYIPWTLDVSRMVTWVPRFNKKRTLQQTERTERTQKRHRGPCSFWFATILAPWFRRPFQSISFYPKDNSHTQLHQDCMTAWEWNESYGH